MACAARSVAEGLSPKGLADTYWSTKNVIFMTFDKLEVEQFHQPRLIDSDFRLPIEAFHGAFFLESGNLQPIRQVFVIAALDFVTEHQF